jgi:uncharacterized membrane protein YhaH (DUF805 family)
MTRTVAMLLSYFGSAVPLAIVLWFFAVFDDPPSLIAMLAVVAFVLAALFIRIYFAVWYARDKDRSGALGLVALFGWLGWLLLILSEDRKVKFPRPVAADHP